MGMRPFDPETLISIDPNLPELSELLNELSQPTFSQTQTGKMIIDKRSGGSSPDRADALMIAFNPSSTWADIWMKCAS
jgi:phage terminase large subunit